MGTRIGLYERSDSITLGKKTKRLRDEGKQVLGSLSLSDPRVCASYLAYVNVCMCVYMCVQGVTGYLSLQLMAFEGPG